jgi:hypothetical protein
MRRDALASHRNWVSIFPVQVLLHVQNDVGPAVRLTGVLLFFKLSPFFL